MTRVEMDEVIRTTREGAWSKDRRVTLHYYESVRRIAAHTVGIIGFAVLNGKTQHIEDDINEASVQVLNLVVANRQKVNLQGLEAA